MSSLNKTAKTYIVIGIILIAILFCIGISLGSSKIDLQSILALLKMNNLEVDDSLKDIMYEIRIPRVLLAIVVGFALAICGLAMQGIVKNKLADPYLLGISSGASLGATIAIMLGVNLAIGSIAVGLNAFIFAMVAAVLILSIAGVNSNNDIRLILSGVALSSLFSAITNFIIFISNDSNATQQLVFWTMGSLNNANYPTIIILTILVLFAFIYFYRNYKILDLMLIGDDSATTLGFNLAKYRIIMLIIISLITGFVVYACGIIPFVGLVVPHIFRNKFKNNHKYLLPICGLGGSVFVLLADILSRTIISYTQIPIGILISLVGCPIFIYSIMKMKKGEH